MGVDTEDNYYSYDGLYQVKQHQRGELMGTYPNYSGIIKPQQDEDWTYDPSGNWDKYSSQLPCNNQIRSQNQANEVTGITSPVGEVVPKYDATGNMITMPVKPGLSTSQYTLTWDGWNRLVEVSNEGSIIAAYIYDGKTRQISKSNINETRHYYFNTEWRALEERVEGASVTVDRKYAWGLIDRSDLVRRTRISGKAVLNEEIFLLRNGLDPVAITGSDGNVVERFGYDAFGEALFKGYDFSSHQDSVFNWNFLFHGEFLDENVKLYNYGYRYYFSQLGRWVNRDPLGELGFEVTRLDFVEHPNFNVDASQLVDDEDGDSTPELQRANSRTASGSQNQVRFMDYEWNRYAFVLNNPVQYTDADGLDITVETGNTGAGFINNGIHQQVCVGCGDNKRCFSFGKIPGLGGVQLPQFSKTWLGWNSWVTGAILRGEIYEADPVMGATIYSRHTTTGAQDSNWLQYMVTSRVGLQDAYSFARHNCRTYSQWEFGNAPKHW